MCLYNRPELTKPGTVLPKYYVLTDTGSQSNPHPWHVCHLLYWFSSLFSLLKSLKDIMSLIIVRKIWKMESPLISVLHMFFLEFQEHIKFTGFLSAFPLTSLIWGQVIFGNQKLARDHRCPDLHGCNSLGRICVGFFFFLRQQRQKIAICFLLTLLFLKRKKNVFVDAWRLRFLDCLGLTHFCS